MQGSGGPSPSPSGGDPRLRGLPELSRARSQSGASSAVQDTPSCCTWVPGVGVWELLSGVLASASAVASSLWVMGRGPAAPE